uniref:Uncharacterized protein n=1 Tax=Mycena chlorophos TaxID=658473 RepID=A0ABQ0LFC3_MYCCL|nr:predicted protein [Mycena chlorophos]
MADFRLDITQPPLGGRLRNSDPACTIIQRVSPSRGVPEVGVVVGWKHIRAVNAFCAGDEDCGCSAQALALRRSCMRPSWWGTYYSRAGIAFPGRRPPHRTCLPPSTSLLLRDTHHDAGTLSLRLSYRSPQAQRPVLDVSDVLVDSEGSNSSNGYPGAARLSARPISTPLGDTVMDDRDTEGRGERPSATSPRREEITSSSLITTNSLIGTRPTQDVFILRYPHQCIQTQTRRGHRAAAACMRRPPKIYPAHIRQPAPYARKQMPQDELSRVDGGPAARPCSVVSFVYGANVGGGDATMTIPCTPANAAGTASGHHSQSPGPRPLAHAPPVLADVGVVGGFQPALTRPTSDPLDRQG